MNWKNLFERRKNMKAIQIIQLNWMAFAIFALGFALPGIPHFTSHFFRHLVTERIV